MKRHTFKLNQKVKIKPIGGGGLTFDGEICNKSRQKYTKKPTYTIHLPKRVKFNMLYDITEDEIVELLD